MEYVIQTDGSGNGHFIALFPDGKAYFGHEELESHNEAEYYGVILALSKLQKNSKAVIQTDSQLVVGQLKDDWKINHEHLRECVDYIRSIIRRKQLDITFEWIRREINRADEKLRNHLKKQPETVITNSRSTQPVRVELTRFILIL